MPLFSLPSRQGAGPGGVQPARGAVGRGILLGAEVEIAIPAGRDGLEALSLAAYSDAGVSVNSTIAGLARLIYPPEAKELADDDVVSNLPPGAPFRGPGGPPMAFALEQAIDEVALRLKADPIQLRKRWIPISSASACTTGRRGSSTWRANRGSAQTQSGRYLRGVGVAMGYWFYIWQVGSRWSWPSRAAASSRTTASQDIGTGTRSVIADTIAREFGLEPHEIEVRIGDFELRRKDPDRAEAASPR